MTQRRAVAVIVAAFFMASFSLQPSRAEDSSTVTTIQTTSVSLSLMPRLVDSPIPTNVTPTISGIVGDRPKPYKDRCHTQQDLTKSESACIYGNLKSKTTIVLFGDSHALSWFPAIERLAIAKKWKLASLTMSSCWPSDILAWNSTKNALMSNCPIWRDETLNDIVSMKPSMIFVAGTRGFSTVDSNMKVLAGNVRTTTWEAGMARTFNILKKASKQVVYISDTPISSVDSPTCLKAHKNSISACATPFSKAVSLSWLAEEAHVASTAGVTYIDPTSWICTTDPCSPLAGKYVIYVDSGHLTASFAWTLEKPLWAQLTAQ